MKVMRRIAHTSPTSRTARSDDSFVFSFKKTYSCHSVAMALALGVSAGSAYAAPGPIPLTEPRVVQTDVDLDSVVGKTSSDANTLGRAAYWITLGPNGNTVTVRQGVTVTGGEAPVRVPRPVWGPSTLVGGTAVYVGDPDLEAGNHRLIELNNQGTLQGGAGEGGGFGLEGYRVVVNNGATGKILGGAGEGESYGNLSVRGMGLGLWQSELDNYGLVQGGSAVGTEPEDGVGGFAVAAQDGSSVTNRTGGVIQGGAGTRLGGGALAMMGGNLINEAGASIIGGAGAGGQVGSSILVGGETTLTLMGGSIIVGDIWVAQGATARVELNADLAVAGGLDVYEGGSVALSSHRLDLAGDAVFREGSALLFSGEGGFSANSVTLDQATIRTNVTAWDQNDILLIGTQNGIVGTYVNATASNPLLTGGAQNYVGAYMVGSDLKYTFRWNDTAGDGYGTFDLRDGANLGLTASLVDSSARVPNRNGWDGNSLTKAGGGQLTLLASSGYSGATHINAGTLKTGVVDAFAQSSGVNVARGATLNLGGNSQSLGAGGVTDNAGTILINDWGAPGQAAPVVVGGDMINRGVLVVNNCQACAGQTYTQQGNWTGQNGQLSLGVVLGGDNSLTDRLVVGGQASGMTLVRFANEGGVGGKTTHGIKVIETGGSASDAFKQEGRLLAGAYDYFLKQGTGSGADMDSWYLVSALSKGARGGQAIYRPEAGSYAGNFAAASTLFNTRMASRQGAGSYIDPVSGVRRTSSVWLRTEAGRQKSHLANDTLKTTSDSSLFQLGGDVWGGSLTGADRLRLGLMAGYAHNSSKSHNTITGFGSRGKVDGYSAGAYGTWLQNGADESGLYVDSWMLYSWFDNKVNGEGLPQEKYKSKGLTASIEAGYALKAASYVTGSGAENAFFVRPQAQLIWSNIRADDLTEANGARVKSLGKGNVQTRLGVRVSMRHQDKQGVRNVEPFVEANWINNSKRYGTQMDGESIHVEGARNLGELKLGLEGDFGRGVSAWAAAAYQKGSSSYKDTYGQVGVKYRF